MRAQDAAHHATRTHRCHRVRARPLGSCSSAHAGAADRDGRRDVPGAVAGGGREPGGAALELREPHLVEPLPRDFAVIVRERPRPGKIVTRTSRTPLTGIAGVGRADAHACSAASRSAPRRTTRAARRRRAARAGWAPAGVGVGSAWAWAVDGSRRADHRLARRRRGQRRARRVACALDADDPAPAVAVPGRERGARRPVAQREALGVRNA